MTHKNDATLLHLILITSNLVCRGTYIHVGSCSYMAPFNSDLQGHLEGIEEHLSRQKQALREASAKHQVRGVSQLLRKMHLHACSILYRIVYYVLF